jgi:trehalose 6-phosphate phosphatase
MESIFAAGVLERLAAEDLLVALDFDGTLAPIVKEPSQAAMRPSTRRLLSEVARLYPCAVVSGRREEDVLALLGGVTVWYVLGNRSLQPPDDVARWSRQVDEWRPQLGALGAIEGVAIEDKSVSLAIHYRNAADHERARDAIVQAAALLGRVRIVAGKDVVNLLPEGGPDKGAAVERVRARIGCTSVLYAGDDRTDEDAFARSRVVGVRVGAEPASAAKYHLRDQDEIDDLLDRLIALRARRTLPQEAAFHPAVRRT